MAIYLLGETRVIKDEQALYRHRLAHRSGERRNLEHRLLTLLEQGTAKSGPKIFFFEKLLVETAAPRNGDTVTQRELIDSLFRKKISPKLLAETLTTVENSLADYYISGKKITVEIRSLSTPNLTRMDVSQSVIEDFYGLGNRDKLRFLISLGVLKVEPLALSDINETAKGQLSLF
jgi:hypothetical protein